MIRIAITYPYKILDEPQQIEEILASGLYDYVHLRKPEFSEDEMRGLINAISAELHPRLSLHSHFGLLDEYLNLGGLHLNGRWGESCLPKILSRDIRITKSLHSVNQLSDAGRYYYVTLSPIYDSISKSGYKSAFNLSELSALLPSVPGRVIALGGVRPENLPELQKAGFAGAAMLSAAWNLQRKI